MAERDLIIIGTGGNALDVLDIVDACNARAPACRVTGFLDDERPAGSVFQNHRVLGRTAEAARFRGEALFVNAIGSDRSYRARERITASTGIDDDDFATLLHPLSAVSATARIGRGTFIGAHASIGSGVQLGRHVIVCAGVIVGHDSIIEDFSVLAPGAVIGGHAHVERSCYIGACSVIRSGVTLAEGMLVGMGAVVLERAVEASVLVGFPARPLRDRLRSSE